MWSTGVLLYELSHGQRPYNEEQLQGFKKLKKPFYNMERFSSSFIHLLDKLLEPNPIFRMSVEEITTHTTIKMKKHIYETRYRKILRE